jgi:hypothetical protein
MNRAILVVSMLLCCAAHTVQADIWVRLFREKLDEASQGSSEAQYDVGTMYLNGRGVKANRDAALEWFTRAADQNNAQAIIRLKLMQENEARFRKTLAAAETGDRDSQYELGNMYTRGVGVEIDTARAIAAYESAAGQGHNKAAYRLGLIHYEGNGVATDMPAALRWFRSAAEGNYPAAQYYLGRMYASGEGTAKDGARALEWLSKAVEGGFDQARGAMIDVQENIAMEEAAREAATRVRVSPKPAPVVKQAKAAARKSGTAPPRQKPDARTWSLEDLMLASWTRDTAPVTFLPSSINNCRIEADRLVCLSDDRTRRTATHQIKYKTKSIISDMSENGTFEVTYRNLVIDAGPLEPAAAGTDAAGGDDEDSVYTVKTGWGSAHRLECEFKDRGTLTCLKNQSHHLVLRSPQTLAVGK